MGYLVLIVGSPGTGKSFSGSMLQSVTWVNSSPTHKPFTWKSKQKIIYTSGMSSNTVSQVDIICEILKTADTKTVILDDIGYAFFSGYAADTFDQKYAYGKNSIALVNNMNRVLVGASNCEKNVIFTLHPQQLNFNKVLKDKFSFDGCFAVVCVADKQNGSYYFDVSNPPAKAPIGMFETETIPNDLSIVLKAMYGYYGGNNE